ncbi:MAG: hypothetical protein AOA66_1699 [Candidatus Bathyarchaeota archaeon BA2]|nr:MAG: hypothetical protein AOA66_1699 [Candidatus Bathyarchaeota archaeon BA2]
MEQVKITLSTDEACMLKGLISGELEVEEIKGTKYALALSEILRKIREPILQPYIMLTPEEIGALKFLLKEHIQTFRFGTEEDKELFMVREVEEIFNRLPKSIEIPEYMKDELETAIAR